MKRPLLLIAAGMAALLGSTSHADAFCRTTTCVCRHPDPTAKDRAPMESACPDECPRDANGCQTRGNPVTWKGRCVGFALNLAGTSTLTPDQWQDALTEAFFAWSSVDCGGGRPPSVQLMPLREVSCRRTEYDKDGPNVNVVYFSDNGWGATKSIDGTLAVAKVHFDGSGEIFDADIAINSGRHDFTVGDDAVDQDLVSIITHEVGHFLGLDHSSNPDSVMYWQYRAGTIRRQLTEDDVAAICTAYPPDRVASCDPVPRGGLGARCDDADAKGCAAGSHEAPTGALLPFALTTFGVLLHRGRLSRRRNRCAS